MHAHRQPSSCAPSIAATLASTVRCPLPSNAHWQLHLYFRHVLPLPLDAVLPGASALLRLLRLLRSAAAVLPLPFLLLLLLPVLVQPPRAVAFRAVQLQVGEAASEAGARLAPAKQGLEETLV